MTNTDTGAATEPTPKNKKATATEPTTQSVAASPTTTVIEKRGLPLGVVLGIAGATLIGGLGIGGVAGYALGDADPRGGHIAIAGQQGQGQGGPQQGPGQQGGQGQGGGMPGQTPNGPQGGGQNNTPPAPGAGPTQPGQQDGSTENGQTDSDDSSSDGSN
jgi:hypothetical protein